MVTTNRYQHMVTTDGQFVVAEIMAHAHRKARVEFEGYIAVNQKYWNAPSPFTYARLFAEELAAAWSWARAVRGAGKGEAPSNAVPMWKAAA